MTQVLDRARLSGSAAVRALTGLGIIIGSATACGGDDDAGSADVTVASVESPAPTDPATPTDPGGSPAETGSTQPLATDAPVSDTAAGDGDEADVAATPADGDCPLVSTAAVVAAIDGVDELTMGDVQRPGDEIEGFAVPWTACGWTTVDVSMTVLVQHMDQAAFAQFPDDDESAYWRDPEQNYVATPIAGVPGANTYRDELYPFMHAAVLEGEGDFVHVQVVGTDAADISDPGAILAAVVANM